MKVASLAELADVAVSHNPAIRKQVMVPAGLVPGVLAFAQARFPPGQLAGAHHHQDMWEIFFVEQGEGTILVDRAETRLAPGVCVVVGPGEVHELANEGKEDLVITYACIGDRPAKASPG